MRALVTGSNGLIGANLLRELVADGAEVSALVREGSDTSHVESLPVTFMTGDVLDLGSLARAVAAQDVVFHTAVPFSYWGHNPAEMKRTAVEGSRNVLEASAAAGVRRVVMTSSSVVLGASREPKVLDEDAVANGDDEESGYVLAKIDQEREAARLAAQLGLEIVFACPTMSVGPFGAALGPSNGVITSYLADPLHLTWAGGCNIVSVRDVARGHVLLALLGDSGSRYVLGSQNLIWPEIHGMIAELAGASPPRRKASAVTCYAVAAAEEARATLNGKPPLVTRSQARMVGRYYWYSHARAAVLGFQPRPAREALADALAWLTPGPHVSRETRMGVRLTREVYDARRESLAREQALSSLGTAG